MNAPHPYSVDEQIAGQRQAESFLLRVWAGDPMGVDELASQIELARQASLVRSRAFAARIQLALQGGGRDA